MITVTCMMLLSKNYIFSILGHFHVMWTDYVSSALLYECYRVEAGQRCSPGADHITMLSRTHNMSQTVYDMMVEKAEQLCFTEERIHKIPNLDTNLLGNTAALLERSIL